MSYTSFQFWQLILPFVVGLSAIALSAITIISSRRNLDRQLKMQLITTIEKEWIENVREYLTLVIQGGFAIKFLLRDHDMSEIEPQKVKQIIDQIINSCASLALLLNRNNPAESGLVDAIMAFANEVSNLVKQDAEKLEESNKAILDAAHKLFDSKKGL